MSTVVKIVLTGIVLFTSALTSVGTAGVSGVVGLAALFAIWGVDWDGPSGG